MFVLYMLVKKFVYTLIHKWLYKGEIFAKNIFFVHHVEYKGENQYKYLDNKKFSYNLHNWIDSFVDY